MLVVGLFISRPVIAEPDTAQQDFINMMVTKHHFKPIFLAQTLQYTTKNEDILQGIKKPWEAKPWYQYYPIFLTEKRLEKGIKFWNTYQQALERAERETGVPAQIIVAIIGVETFYGSYTGKYSVLDALFTLGFYYPPRASFFKSELEHLFLLAREENLSLTNIQGSYAGAMGWGQFIASSYRAYAVDFDHDGAKDLFNSPIDAIGSVANYFKRHGWKAGEDVAYKVRVSGTAYQALLNNDLRLKDTWQSIHAKGVDLVDQTHLAHESLLPTTKGKLLDFEQADHKEYWLALNNFYCITRYNHSPLYAMAVFQFSQQLLKAHKEHVYSE